MEIQFDIRPTFLETLRKFVKAEVLEVLQGLKPKTEEIEGYLTVKSAAKYLDTSTRTVDRWCNDINHPLEKVYLEGVPRIQKCLIDISFERILSKRGGLND